MNLACKLAAPAIAVAALVAGAPAAMATTTSAASVSSAAHPAVQNSPDSGPHWAYYNTYPTYAACSSAGSTIGLANAWRFECVETEGIGGAYWQWDLYFWW